MKYPLRSSLSRIFLVTVAAAAVALGMAVVLQADAYNRAQINIERSLSYDIAWTGVNGRLEMASLRTWVATYARTQNPADAKVAKLYFEILKGRLTTWGAGGFSEFIEESPRRSARFQQIKGWIKEIEPEMARLDQPGVAGKVSDTLEDAARVMDLIGGQAHIASVDHAAQMREQLRWHHDVQRTLVISSIWLSTMLLGFLAVQNRSLKQARKTAETHAARTEFTARHDHLTRLPNRRAFCEVAEEVVAACSPENFEIALLALDLDGFKAINDALGHAAGDELLVSVAKRLKDRVQSWHPDNVVSRFGGDEFMVLLHVSKGTEEVRRCARQLVDVMGSPHIVGGGSVIVNLSVGYAIADRPVEDPQWLMLNADLALSAAKGQGKGVVVGFAPEMRTEQERRTRIERDLSNAVRSGAIAPVFQVQVDMLTGRPLGIEALARWNHADLGPISPGEFIPIAEASGKVFDLGLSVLRSACTHAVNLPDELCLSVNLSVAQLTRDDLVERVAQVLTDTGFPAERLKLEVTETVLMQDRARSIAMLNRLKAIGVRISLDDFGTGYSALSYLRDFNWDELKIDKRFVDSAVTDPQSRAIIGSLLDLAQELGVAVVVEGIETAEQHNLLVELGCTVGQGFYYGCGVCATQLPDVFTHCLKLSSQKFLACAEDADEADRPQARPVNRRA